MGGPLWPAMRKASHLILHLSLNSHHPHGGRLPIPLPPGGPQKLLLILLLKNIGQELELVDSDRDVNYIMRPIARQPVNGRIRQFLEWQPHIPCSGKHGFERYLKRDSSFLAHSNPPLSERQL